MIKTFLKIFMAASFVLYLGCGDDDTTNPPPPPTDTTVANFNDLLISERTIPFDLAFSAVDLNTGVIVRDSSSIKDANLIDSLFVADSVFYFRSGDLSDEPFSVPGYQTRFKLVMLTATQSQFDTMSVIPDTDDTLTESDFTTDNTASFSAPLLFNTVYGFYLKGKYDNNVTPFRVFGMLYLDYAYYDSSGFHLRFDVKINKVGRNRFKVIIA